MHEHELARRLTAAVGRTWAVGWQPADLVRVARRSAGEVGADVVRDAIADDLRAYADVTIDPAWHDQLKDLDCRVWWAPDQTYLCGTAERTGLVALGLIHTLSALPTIEMLGPIPGTANGVPRAAGPERAGAGPDAARVDDRVLARVRALLAKAESTTFPAEAETFTAGAQALMARHSLDRALLASSTVGAAAAANAGGPNAPGARRIGIDSPYEAPKTMLLAAVATANRCRVVWQRSFGFCTAIGYPCDLDGIELLFTSLLVQATAAMTQAGSRTDQAGRSRTRSFRQSFLTAYASRIGERLAEATRLETEQVLASTPGNALLPVLAARDDAVQARVKQLFPRMRHLAPSVTNREGWASGWRAADRATLGTRGELTG